MSCLLTAAAAHHPNSGFDVFTILGIIGIILGIIVLALRVASHGQTDCTRHGAVGFTIADAPDLDPERDDADCSECVAGK